MSTGRRFVRQPKHTAVILVLLLLLTAGVHLIFAGSGPGPDSGEIDKTFIRKYKLANDHFSKLKKYFVKKDLEKAEKELRKCLEIMPRHVKSHYFLSQILYQKGDFQQALKHIEAAESNSLVIGHTLRGIIEVSTHNMRRKKQELRKWFDAAQNAGSQDGSCAAIPILREVKSELREIEGKQQRSTASLEQVPAEYFYAHGNVLFKMKRYKEALHQYIKTIAADPSHGKAYNNLANLYFMAKRYDIALNCLEKAEQNGVEINPKLKAAVIKGCESTGTYTAKKTGPTQAEKFTVQVGEGGRSLNENTYVAYNQKTADAVIIDPGTNDRRIEQFIASKKLDVKMILNTHGHYDHIGGNSYFAGLYDVDIAAHKADSHYYREDNAKNKPNRLLSHDETLDCGALKIKVIHTPGHTPGSCCFLIEHLVFSGDTLFKGSIGKVGGKTPREVQEGTVKEIAAIKSRLLPLPSHTDVLPGHGPGTTIENEKTLNPFLNTAAALELMKRSFRENPNVLGITLNKNKSETNNHDIDIVFSNADELASFKKNYGEYVMGLKLHLSTQTQ
jgi:glyoxylase-like metal-dependent hydrolase (beta-lactamase superfamily II)/TolA-binding protein